MDKNKKFYVYIILTVNNKLYCGYTDDVERRYKLHKEGKGAKFTKANKPFKLVYVKEFDSKNDAMKEECRIKKLTRKQKEKIINMPCDNTQFVSFMLYYLSEGNYEKICKIR